LWLGAIRFRLRLACAFYSVAETRSTPE
jgi:hypothetical protein